MTRHVDVARCLDADGGDACVVLVLVVVVVVVVVVEEAWLALPRAG